MQYLKKGKLTGKERYLTASESISSLLIVTRSSEVSNFTTPDITLKKQ